jgi:hypothetical protein
MQLCWAILFLFLLVTSLKRMSYREISQFTARVTFLLFNFCVYYIAQSFEEFFRLDHFCMFYPPWGIESSHTRSRFDWKLRTNRRSCCFHNRVVLWDSLKEEVESLPKLRSLFKIRGRAIHQAAIIFIHTAVRVSSPFFLLERPPDMLGVKVIYYCNYFSLMNCKIC